MLEEEIELPRVRNKNTECSFMQIAFAAFLIFLIVVIVD